MTVRLLKHCFKTTVVQLVKQMSESKVKIEAADVVNDVVKVRYDGRIKKRNWEDRRSDRSDDTKRTKTDEEFVRIKRRKYAMLLGYSGVNYYGMQRNPQMKTIEEDLLNALLKVELITEEAHAQIQSIQFQRAARTDKGVSAARQVVSLKLPEEVNIEPINKELPEQIRVFSVKRVTKGFNSKSNCDARTYIYMLPTFSFAKHDTEINQNEYRISDETFAQVNEILKMFTGTRNFHNFTSKKNFKDPSANRFIMSFECERPFVKDNVEFAVIKVKGQSFMLHQIRKMIGLSIAVVRGLTTSDIVTQAYSSDRLDIPMAPGLGLVLDQVHYDRYNARYANTHDTLDWVESEKDVTEFKEKFIYPTIVETEINEKSMMTWLETLPRHSYSVRNEDSVNVNNDENENDNENGDESDDESSKDVKQT